MTAPIILFPHRMPQPIIAGRVVTAKTGQSAAGTATSTPRRRQQPRPIPLWTRMQPTGGDAA